MSTLTTTTIVLLSSVTSDIMVCNSEGELTCDADGCEGCTEEGRDHVETDQQLHYGT